MYHRNASELPVCSSKRDYRYIFRVRVRLDKTQDKTRPDKTRQDKTRQDKKDRRDKTRQFTTATATATAIATATTTQDEVVSNVLPSDVFLRRHIYGLIDYLAFGTGTLIAGFQVRVRVRVRVGVRFRVRVRVRVS